VLQQMIFIHKKLKYVLGFHNNQIYSFVQISAQNSMAYVTQFRPKMEMVYSDFRDLISCNVCLVSCLIMPVLRVDIKRRNYLPHSLVRTK
jgi:hypothetical protein